MARQDQEQRIERRKLVLLFLLFTMVALGLLYSLSLYTTKQSEFLVAEAWSFKDADEAIISTGVPNTSEVPGCRVDLDVDPLAQLAMPGQSVPYTLTVHNIGTSSGTASIETHPPLGWSFSLMPSSTTTLQPNESATWLLSLTVPPCEGLGDKTTGVTAALNCTSIGRTSTDPQNVTTTILTPIAVIEPDIVKTVKVTNLDHDIEVTLTHIVSNTGNLTDTFDFDSHSVQGWSVEEPESKTLEPNISTTVEFRLTVPAHTLIVSDTLVITATPRLAPCHNDTTTDWVRDGRMFLPIVAKNFCEGTLLCNGDFEGGSLQCWKHSHYGVSNELPAQIGAGLSGQHSALLGNPDYYWDGGVEIGCAWMEQTFKVPSNGNPTLSFTYRMHTQDKVEYDTFAVYLNEHLVLLKTGYTGEDFGDGDTHIISGTCQVDLANLTDCDGNPINTNFLCTEVTLRFENCNQRDCYYNTWTYVDDVEFTW